MNPDQTQIALLIIGIVAGLILARIKLRIERKGRRVNVPPILTEQVDLWGDKR